MRHFLENIDKATPCWTSYKRCRDVLSFQEAGHKIRFHYDLLRQGKHSIFDPLNLPFKGNQNIGFQFNAGNSCVLFLHLFIYSAEPKWRTGDMIAKDWLPLSAVRFRFWMIVIWYVCYNIDCKRELHVEFGIFTTSCSVESS